MPQICRLRKFWIGQDNPPTFLRFNLQPLTILRASDSGSSTGEPYRTGACHKVPPKFCCCSASALATYSHCACHKVPPHPKVPLLLCSASPTHMSRSRLICSRHQNMIRAACSPSSFGLPCPLCYLTTFVFCLTIPCCVLYSV